MRHDECRRNPDRSWSAGLARLQGPFCFSRRCVPLIAALLAGQLLLANRTQTFMGNAAGFVGQFFPIFLLGAPFGKLMEASGSVEVIAKYLTERLGTKRAMLAIVLASCWRRWATPCSRLPIYGRGHRTRKEDACVGQSTLLLSRSNMGAPTAFSSC
jgi:GntP family permease